VKICCANCKYFEARDAGPVKCKYFKVVWGKYFDLTLCKDGTILNYNRVSCRLMNPNTEFWENPCSGFKEKESLT